MQETEKWASVDEEELAEVREKPPVACKRLRARVQKLYGSAVKSAESAENRAPFMIWKLQNISRWRS